MGTAMFAALAAGGPIGTALNDKGGFALVAITTSVLPLAAVALIAPLTGTPPARARRFWFLSIAGRLWVPGLAATCGSIGFGALIAFSTLLFASHGWKSVWLAFTAYAVALVVTRLLLGHLIAGQAGLAVVFLVSAAIALCGIPVALHLLKARSDVVGS